MGPDRSAGIVTIYRLDNQVKVQASCEVNQASCGYRSYFAGLNLSGPEAGHFSPSSADVRNSWSYQSTPAMCLHDVLNYSLTYLLTYLLHGAESFLRS